MRHWHTKKPSKAALYVIEDKEKDDNGEPKTNGYKRTIVLPAAYYRDKDESSLSLYQIVKEYRAKRIKNLQSEADAFFMFLPREQRSIKKSDRPVALIKEYLLKKISQHNIDNILPRGICKTKRDGNVSDVDKQNRTEFLACHWDIHLTEKNLAPENLELLYGILASSSLAFRNNNANAKISVNARMDG